MSNPFKDIIENGTFAARAIYAWNSTYTYGANELVYYPNEGELGVFLKSLTPNNNYSPYEGDILNTKYWRLVTDFNILVLTEAVEGIFSFMLVNCSAIFTPLPSPIALVTAVSPFCTPSK